MSLHGTYGQEPRRDLAHLDRSGHWPSSRRGRGSALLHVRHQASLHPNPQNVKSVIESDPSPQWTAAVEKGREVVRAGLTDQNLPGMSVAVGVGQDIVWAEGFGWADVEKRVPVAPRTRFRIGHVSKALTSAAVGPAPGKGSVESRRRGTDCCARVPAETMARHTAPVDGAHGRVQALPRRVCGRAQGALRESVRRVEQLQRRSSALRTGDRVPLFDLRLGPGERGGRSCCGRAVLQGHAIPASSRRWA
jgi:hypothetical protein